MDITADDINMVPQDFIKVYDHGKNPIDLSHHSPIALEMRLTELHYKVDGDLENNPAFCLVMEYPGQPVVVYAQFSLNTIQKALAELGYTLYQP